jgi:hypothetical protein
VAVRVQADRVGVEVVEREPWPSRPAAAARTTRRCRPCPRARHSKTLRPVAMSISCSTPSCSTPSAGPPSALQVVRDRVVDPEQRRPCGVITKSCWSACSVPAARTRAISRYDMVGDHELALADALPAGPPDGSLPPGQHRLVAVQLRLEVDGHGGRVGHLAEPDRRALLVHHAAGPTGRCRRRASGRCSRARSPFAGVVIVTSGSVRRSGRERYFGGPAWRRLGAVPVARSRSSALAMA